MERRRTAQFVMTVGPGEASERIRRALSEPVYYHEDPDFMALFQDTEQKLQAVFQTQQDVIVMQGEALLGLEAAAACCFQEGDTVLNLVSGIYGSEYKWYIEVYGARAIEITVPYNEAIDPAEVEKALNKHPEIKYLSVVHCETPSGTLNPIREICTIARQHGVISIVDAVASLGTVDIRPDEWGIDICVAGPQKALSGTPGLSLISVSEAAWESMRNRQKPVRYSYLSMLDWKELWQKQRKWPYTPLVSEVVALNEALDEMLSEGLPQVFERHARAARACREGIKALGLQLWPASEEISAPAVTAITTPAGIDEAQLRKQMYEKYGVLICGATKALMGQLFRIGHMGRTAEPMHVVVALAALERSLYDLGYPVKLGSGVGAALASL